RLLDINNESNPELESTQQSANYPGVIEGNFWLTRLGWGVQKLPKGQVIKRGDDFYRVVTEENGKKQLASVLPFKQSLPSYQQTVSSIATPEKPHKITLGNNLAAELYKDQ